MKKLYIDLETYNSEPISNGSYKYAETVEVILFAYAIDDGNVHLWDVTQYDTPPKDLLEAWLDDEYVVICHNGGLFDRVVLNNLQILPEIPSSRWLDTMVQAYCHGLSGSLEKLGEVFGLREDQTKMKEGRSLIHMFCKPVKGERKTAQDYPEQWKKFCQYAVRDVESMRVIHKKLPTWNYPGSKFFKTGERSDEYNYWLIDLEINDRGLQIDTDLCVAAMQTAIDERDSLNARTAKATEDEVQAATQRDAMLAYITQSYGVKLPDLRADTLKRRVDDESLPEPLRELLNVRLMSGKNTSSKYKAAVNAVNADGRVRGTLQFCGAPMTGRDAGRIIQPQNFARPSMEQDEIEEAIEVIKAGNADLIFDNTADVLSNCVRGMLIPAPGCKFVSADLSAIEARTLPWLAGEEDVLDFFRGLDKGEITFDSYQRAYGAAFNVEPLAVTKLQRSIGKAMELGLGYGGGASAFVTFAMTFHLDLEEIREAVYATADSFHLSECEGKWEWAKSKGFHAGLKKNTYAAVEYLKQKWRESRPETVALWASLADAMTAAINYEKEVFKVGKHVALRRDGQWLRIRLPSGRCLNLVNPKVTSDGLTYMGHDRYSRQWKRQYTHGGKISGWVTQAAASDLLREAYRDATEDGMPPVLRVHDELVCEVPDRSEYTVDRLVGHMTRTRKWSSGLPLAADGWEGYRYRK